MGSLARWVCLCLLCAALHGEEFPAPSPLEGGPQGTEESSERAEPGYEPADESPSGFLLVPRGRLFPLTFADPSEIRTAVAFGASGLIQAWVGSYISLFAVEGGLGSWDFHFGLEGRGYFTLRQEGARFPLETVDGTIGLYMELARGPWAAQLRYTHVSAHLADGSTGTPFVYSRERVSLRGAYSAGEWVLFYVGLHRLVHTIPAVHGLALQAGTVAYLPVSRSLSPFLAADLAWHEETRVNPSFSVQLGLAMHAPNNPARAFRMYYSYYTGADPRGQFLYQQSTLHSLGVEFSL